MEKDMATKYTAQAKYDRANTKYFSLKLNIKTDVDILERISEQGNFQGYIKKLIRDDIARHTGTRLTVTASKAETEISDDFTEPE